MKITFAYDRGRTAKYLIVFFIAVALAMLVYRRVYIPKHTFNITRPSEGQLQLGIKGIGNVNALNIYPITAQTGGRIVQILADEGGWVKKGGLLVVMDGVDLPAQLAIAKANLSKAEFDIKVLDSELANQKARQTLLQLTFNRYKRLSDQGFAARSEFDQAQADLLGIQADMAATGARIKSAQAARLAASKGVRALREKIGRLKVYAPAAGYVISKEAEVGQNVLPSTPILRVVDPTSLWVEAKIDERLSAQVKPGQKAVITLRSQPGRQYAGVVKRIEAMSDAVTFERTIDIAFAKIPAPFFINEQAQVNISVKQYKNVLKIPLSAVSQQAGKTGLWLKRAGHAHFTAVKEIARNETEMAVVAIGQDAAIIMPDSHKKTLSEGMRVYP
jgi:RND family efflux transporter MFP subunit